MTESSATAAPGHQDGEEISLLALAGVLLRSRRVILSLGLLGAAWGLATGLQRPRVFASTAVFVPQGSETGVSGVAQAAGQLGIRLPSATGLWGPEMYVELLQSRALLEPIALDSVAVPGDGGRRVSLTDLLGTGAPTAAERIDLTIQTLRGIVAASEIKALGAVKVTVTTRWPGVSLTLAELLVEEVNQFNLETRKSQASAERQFVEVQTVRAERTLREAEDRLQEFLQRNREIAGSPELVFVRDRLQRDVTLRQQIYTSLLLNREEASIREVRDIPVITVLEPPRLPVKAEARGTAQRIILGGLLGGLLGVLMAFLANGLATASRARSEEAREFFELLSEITPKFLRKGAR